jgi:hypothetical protein
MIYLCLDINRIWCFWYSITLHNHTTGEKKKNVGKRIYSSSSSCSDSTDDEKHAKKKHSMQSVERSKNESEMDNSPEHFWCIFVMAYFYCLV